MENRKIVFIMVGLPARGKTFLASRFNRYLDWQGYKTKIFNVGQYRRNVFGASNQNSDFFDPHNAEFAKEREALARLCFGDLMRWLKSEGEIAIYDATNVTKKRRDYLAKLCLENDTEFVFVENIVSDPEIIDEMIKIKIQNSADYKDKDIGFAEKDFRERMAHYEKVYDLLDDKYPNIKIFNLGEATENKFFINDEFLSGTAQFLKSINLKKKNIFLVRHGESLFNLQNRIGGDSVLSDKGREYSAKIAKLFKGQDITIFTSDKARTKEMANFFNQSKTNIRELNEINSGICDGMTYEEIACRYPEIDSARKADKFKFRYPEGESYRDVIRRVAGVIANIEAQKKDVLIIGHRAVNRCLLSYFIKADEKDIPYIDMPLGEIIKISPAKDQFEYEILRVE